MAEAEYINLTLGPTIFPAATDSVFQVFDVFLDTLEPGEI